MILCLRYGLRTPHLSSHAANYVCWLIPRPVRQSIVEIKRFS